jgi:hypothetical protein
MLLILVKKFTILVDLPEDHMTIEATGNKSVLGIGIKA